MVVDLGGGVDAGLRVAIKGVEQRVAEGVIVGSELGFDVRERNVAADADVHALRHLWKVEVRIHHHWIIAIFFVLTQQLLTEDAVRGGEAVVQAPQIGDAEAPIKMIGLHRVWLALYVDHFLIGLDGIGHLVVGRGEVAVLTIERRRRTEPGRLIRCAKCSSSRRNSASRKSGYRFSSTTRRGLRSKAPASRGRIA